VKLKKAFVASQVKFTAVDDGFKVSGKSTDEVGRLLFAAQLPVLELAQQDASLEEAFLELTTGTEEFSTKGGQR
jgi:ABC-2 type transport system ATP-binding protein